MTAYKLSRFPMSDAQALVGKIADITEWYGDEMERKITYPAARVIGIIDSIGSYLHIQTGGAVVTDATTSEHLGTLPAGAEWNVAFTLICEVTGIRDPDAGS